MEKNRKVKAVRSLEKALEILDAFNEKRPEMNLSELSSITGYPMPTVYRLVSTLRSKGFVTLSDSKNNYRLGLKFFEIASRVARGTGLLQAAYIALENLSSISGENASLSVFDGKSALCMASFDSSDSLKATINIGERVPLHAGALSRTLLAYLPNTMQERIINDPNLEIFTENTKTDPDVLMESLQSVKELGYAYSVSEAVPGVASLAAPIRDFRSKVVGAVAILAPIQRMQPDRKEYLLNVLLDCTSEISKNLGYMESEKVLRN